MLRMSSSVDAHLLVLFDHHIVLFAHCLDSLEYLGRAVRSKGFDYMVFVPVLER